MGGPVVIEGGNRVLVVATIIMGVIDSVGPVELAKFGTMDIQAETSTEADEINDPVPLAPRRGDRLPATLAPPTKRARFFMLGAECPAYRRIVAAGGARLPPTTHGEAGRNAKQEADKVMTRG